MLEASSFGVTLRDSVSTTVQHERETSCLWCSILGRCAYDFADAFKCEEVRRLNEDSFEAVCFAASVVSCDFASFLVFYETYQGSLASSGKLQLDVEGRTPKSSRRDGRRVSSNALYRRPCEILCCLYRRRLQAWSTFQAAAILSNFTNKKLYVRRVSTKTCYAISFKEAHACSWH